MTRYDVWAEYDAEVKKLYDYPPNRYSITTRLEIDGAIHCANCGNLVAGKCSQRTQSKAGRTSRLKTLNAFCNNWIPIP